MLRILISYFSFFAVAASACEDILTSVQIREAIYAGDVATVEVLLDENQELFEAGQRDVRDTRCMFGHFQKIRPATFEFVEDWLRAFPSSPYALTARALGSYRVSWQVRGTKPAHESYPEAMSEFSRLQRAAWKDADAAYAERPRLIAASDVLIQLANPNRQQPRRDEVLHDVMSVDPNPGTLRRAVAQVIKGWGGTWEAGASMCETYAPMLAAKSGDPVARCKLPLARRFEDQWGWMNETLATGLYPEFDYLRFDFLFGSEHAALTRDDTELVHRVMSDQDYLANRYLTEYDQLALHFGLPLLTEIVSQRRYDYAKKEIEHSPLSVDLLDILAEPVMTSARNEKGTLRVSVLARPEDKCVLEYARRRVQASPYSPVAWQDLLSAVMRNELITNLMQSEPYRINAIVYDNHSPDRLSGYIFEKIQEYDAVQMAARGEFPADLMSMFEGIDEERDMVCPIIRAVRLLDMACERSPHPACDLGPTLEGPVATIETHAKHQGICFKERSLPAASLLFSPMSLPVFAH